MEPLSLNDKRQVDAAEGWVGLGNCVEAEKELDEVAPESQSHPDVLKVRWEIYSALKRWVAALNVANALVESEPESPLGWVYRSKALHHLKRTGEARDNLLQVVKRFSKNTTLRYDLACYECQSGNLATAGEHLAKALKFSGSPQLRLRALKDRDLAPLWREHGITYFGNICAPSVDLSAKPHRNRTAFILSLVFWAMCAAGVAWRNHATTRVDFAEAGFSAAGALFAVSLLLLASFGGLLVRLEAWIHKVDLPAGYPVFELTSFGFALLLGSLIGGFLALCCWLSVIV